MSDVEKLEAEILHVPTSFPEVEMTSPPSPLPKSEQIHLNQYPGV